MCRKITLLLIWIYITMIVICGFWGEDIRNSLSVKVDVMAPVYYEFSDKTITMYGLSKMCFFKDENGNMYAYVVEKRDETGESAYFARKVGVKVGRSDEVCIELISSDLQDGMYICKSDTAVNDGDRVVVRAIYNTPLNIQ